MEGIGGKLRATRLAWKLTLRDVEKRTTRLSEQWGDPAYRISASWLDRVERENRELSAAKLVVLASVYSLTPEQMLGIVQTAATTQALLDEQNKPNVTMYTDGRLDDDAKVMLPDDLWAGQEPEKTGYLPPDTATLPAHYRRAIIGRQDRTLEPMIRAGSVLMIDTQKKTIAGRREWNHEFDRPIYFLYTRDGYTAGFCELDRENEWLTVIPHALSYESNRRYRYKKEIEVVGTVVAVASRRTP
jgi:transcriptional regulator with XRE-family HTH domain